MAPRPGAQRVLPAAAAVSQSTEPPIWDQGDLGSCTAFTGTYLVEQLRRRLGLPALAPSQLYLYWWTRYLEGGTAQTKVDTGATIRDTVKATAAYGTATNALWPYLVGKFTAKPSTAAQRTAANRQVLQYQRCSTVEAVKASVADGYPVAFGWSVYESAMSAAVAKSGAVPMPRATEQLLGGHACAIRSYDDATQRFGFRNSWGRGWGRSGLGTIPYSYLTNPQLAGDYWTVRAVEPG